MDDDDNPSLRSVDELRIGSAVEQAARRRKTSATSRMGTSRDFFDSAFAMGTAGYVAAFSYVVYTHTQSAVARLGVSLLVAALPALLATELCGGDEHSGTELARTWLQEFVGTAIMVSLTCCPGALVGHLGKETEWSSDRATRRRPCRRWKAGPPVPVGSRIWG